MTTRTITEADDTVVAYWLANKADAYATVLEGEKFTPTKGTPYYSLRLLEDDSAQDTQGKPGNRRYLRDRVLLIECFYPAQISGADQGARPAVEMARQARAVFEGKTITGCHFTKGIQILSVDEDGEWISRAVRAEFFHEEIK